MTKPGRKRSKPGPAERPQRKWPTGTEIVASRGESFVAANKGHIAHDHDGDIVYLTRLQWDIGRTIRDHPALTLTATKEMMA